MPAVRETDLPGRIQTPYTYIYEHIQLSNVGKEDPGQEKKIRRENLDRRSKIPKLRSNPRPSPQFLLRQPRK
jgi:hypothetical protein